jgi:hypothetical protein
MIKYNPKKGALAKRRGRGGEGMCDFFLNNFFANVITIISRQIFLTAERGGGRGRVE